MNYEQQMKEIKKIIKNGEYSIAEEMLLSLLENSDVQNIDDGEYTYYCCKNYIEMSLVTKYYNLEKENVLPDINLADIYGLLAQISIYRANFGYALEYLTLGLRWNPAAVDMIFQMADIYKLLGHYEKYITAIQLSYNYIYSSYYLAEYYRKLAWYYMHINKPDFAKALYIHSFEFEANKNAMEEFSNVFEKIETDNAITEKTIKYMLNELGIQSTYSEVVLATAVEEYMKWKKAGTKTNNFKFTSRVLYDMTRNKKYMLYVTLKDEAKGIKVLIPETWAHVKKSNYNKLDLPEDVAFRIKSDLDEELEVLAITEASEADLESHVVLMAELLNKNGHKVLTIDKTIGDKEMMQIVFDTTLEDGTSVRTVDTYLVVNNLLLSARLNFIYDIDVKELYSNETYIWYMDIIKSINKI